MLGWSVWTKLFGDEIVLSMSMLRAMIWKDERVKYLLREACYHHKNIVSTRHKNGEENGNEKSL